MNDFMLASKNRQESLSLIRQNISTTDFVYRVLFEMKIPSDYSLQNKRPFIDISYLNDYNKSVDEDKDIYSIFIFYWFNI